MLFDHLTKTLTLMTLLSVSSSLAAIEIFTHPINGLIQANGGGSYQLMFHKINAALKRTDPLIVLPFRRALRSFEEDKNACFLSGENAVNLNQNYYISSHPIGSVQLHFFNLRSDEKPITWFSDLKIEAFIGGESGVDKLYKANIPKRFKIEFVASLQQRINMLKAGKVQAILGFIPDLTPYLEHIQYDKNFVLFDGHDRLMCHNTAPMKTYIESINYQLRALNVGHEHESSLIE